MAAAVEHTVGRGFSIRGTVESWGCFGFGDLNSDNCDESRQFQRARPRLRLEAGEPVRSPALKVTAFLVWKARFGRYASVPVTNRDDA